VTEPKSTETKASAAKPAAAAKPKETAAAPATSSAATATASAASSGSGASASTGSGGSGGGSGSGYGTTSSGESGGGMFSLPLVMSAVAIVIAIVIPVLSGSDQGPAQRAFDPSALEQRQQELTDTVAALEAQIGALTEEQAALTTSIAAVKVPALMIAASDLRAAIAGGGSFAEEFNLFRAIVGEDEAVANVYTLEPLAASGVPTMSDLQASFGEVSHAVVAKLQTVEADGTLAERMSQTMANLTAATTRLRWRIDGAPAGDDPLSVMARAELAAEAGDFDTVTTELDALPEELAAMASDWREQVEAQKQAQAAIEELDLFMIETVAQNR
jgi:hypothetical protein